MSIVERKSGRYIAEVKSTTGETNAPHGSFEAVLSVPSVDRDKEVLDAGAFNPLPEHITIDIDHAMTVEKTIGSGHPFYDGPVLKFAGTYASHPLAQMVRSLVDEGHIRTMSVAYMNSHYEIDENDGLAHMRKAELLNAGIVGIPSNREALITASKSLVTSVTEAVTDPDSKSLESADSIETTTETNPEKSAAAAASAAGTAAVPPAPSAVVALTGRARAGTSATALLIWNAANPTE